MEFSGQIDRDGIRALFAMSGVNGVGHGRVVGCQSRDICRISGLCFPKLERAVSFLRAACVGPKCVEFHEGLCQTSSFGDVRGSSDQQGRFTMA